jgi:hypothetical protein
MEEKLKRKSGREKIRKAEPCTLRFPYVYRVVMGYLLSMSAL